MRYGYVRVSTKDQDTGSQRHKLDAAGIHDEAIFEDIGVSGSKSSRPGLNQLLPILQPGDEVVVFRLDRLGRSLRNLVELADDLDRRGIIIESISEGIRTDTPQGRMMLQIFAMVGEWERAFIIERVNAGVARAKVYGTKSGKPIGRPRKSSRAVALALSLVEQGHSHREAAQIARIDPSTLTRARQRDGIGPQATYGQIDLEAAIRSTKKAA